MAQTTVRIGEATHHVLRELARAEGRPMLAVLESAVEAYRRQRFLAEVNAGYAALREDPGAEEEMETERREWDGVLEDGLPAGETWTEDGPPRSRRGRGGR